jgi:hypothetical protein
MAPTDETIVFVQTPELYLREQSPSSQLIRLDRSGIDGLNTSTNMEISHPSKRSMLVCKRHIQMVSLAHLTRCLLWYNSKHTLHPQNRLSIALSSATLTSTLMTWHMSTSVKMITWTRALRRGNHRLKRSRRSSKSQ